MQTTEQLIGILKDMLAQDHAVHAFYEGGSAAFNAKDAYSDYDLLAIIDDGSVGRIVDIVRSSLQKHFGIDLEYDVPNPWHGYRQVFFHLKDFPEWTLIDFVFIHRSDAKRLNEVERHGNYKVYFDKGGFVQQPKVDQKDLAQKLKVTLSTIQGAIAMFHAFVDKEILRQRPVDAMSFYVAHILPRYVQLLRIKYDPARYDFGFRYLYRDLPLAEAREVERLFFVRDVDDLLQKKQQVHTKIQALLAELLKTDAVR